MLNFFQRIAHRRNEDGASAVEYGLLVAAIAAVIVVVVFALGKMIGGAFKDTCNAVKDGTTPTNATAQCDGATTPTN
jgi:pilus assembly protein Flp/PilA